MLAEYSPRRLSDEEAERAVLSAMLIDYQVSLRLSDMLLPSDFYNASHAAVHQAMCEIIKRGNKLDEIIVCNELRLTNTLDKAGGEDAIGDLARNLSSIAHADEYAKVVRENSLARSVATSLMDGLRQIYHSQDTLQVRVDTVERELLAATSRRQSVPIVSSAEGVKAVVSRLEKMRSEGNAIAGIPSGIDDFDKMINGWRPGTLNVIAGRPGMGKTAFALQCAQRAAVDWKLPVVIFSFEMKFEPLFTRMISNQRRINGQRMQNGQLMGSEYAKMTDACSTIQGAPIYVVESHSMMAGDVAAMARRMKHDLGLRMIVVDYIQKVPAPSFQTQEREVAYTVERLSRMAAELDIAVLALSQLNRGAEGNTDRRPEVSNLLASGRIEADADTITMLYRSDYYGEDKTSNGDEDNTIELLVRKNRSGESGTVKAFWDGQYSRIDNIKR